MHYNYLKRLTITASKPCVCCAPEKAKDRNGGHRFGLLERTTTMLKKYHSNALLSIGNRVNQSSGQGVRNED
jgi:hypothetical protein